MAFIRKVKRGKKTYYYLVETYRADGKVKQRTLQYLGTKKPRGKRRGLPSITTRERDMVRGAEAIDKLGPVSKEVLERLANREFNRKANLNFISQTKSACTRLSNQIRELGRLMKKREFWKDEDWAITDYAMGFLFGVYLKGVRDELNDMLNHPNKPEY